MFKLLVVDDEPDLLHSIREWLQSETLAVEVAQTGLQGVALVRQLQPDAVLLDLSLSDTPWLEVLTRLREFDARLPVILITDHAAAETAIEAMKHGAFEYLLKPVDCERLREVVQRVLELSRFRPISAVFGHAALTRGGEHLNSHITAMSGVALPATWPPAPAVSLAGLADFTAALLRAGEPDIYRRVGLEIDRVILRTVLQYVNGNQVKASEVLGISRTTLRAKLRDLRGNLTHYS